jgi:hypothetical protein
LLATAIVVAAGLTFGRQALVWWRGEASPAEPLVVTSRLGQASPHRLAFGDVPLVFEREVMTGDRPAVLERLAARCRAIAESRPQVAWPPGPAERNMLRRIPQQRPVLETNGFRVYQLERPLPMATGVAELPAEDGSGPRDRVVCWGLAMPIGKGESAPQDHKPDKQGWTLFTWSAGSGLRASRVPLPDLPPRARRTMLLSADDGSALLAFRVEGEPRDVMNDIRNHFTGEASGDDWTMVTPWSASRDAWHARFRSAEGDAVDVQLAVDNDGLMSGVMTVVPAPPTSEE